MTSTPIHGQLADISSTHVSHSDAQWQPIRNHFGITAFGINAYTARSIGDVIIGEHDHADPEDERHQELYFVHTGRARFTVDGKFVDAPAGTFVNVPDIRTKRSAIAEEADTVILVIGAEAGAAFEVTPAERAELAGAGFAVS